MGGWLGCQWDWGVKCEFDWYKKLNLKWSFEVPVSFCGKLSGRLESSVRQDGLDFGTSKFHQNGQLETTSLFQIFELVPKTQEWALYLLRLLRYGRFVVLVFWLMAASNFGANDDSILNLDFWRWVTRELKQLGKQIWVSQGECGVQPNFSLKTTISLKNVLCVRREAVRREIAILLWGNKKMFMLLAWDTLYHCCFSCALL